MAGSPWSGEVTRKLMVRDRGELLYRAV